MEITNYPPRISELKELINYAVFQSAPHKKINNIPSYYVECNGTIINLKQDIFKIYNDIFEFIADPRIYNSNYIGENTNPVKNLNHLLYLSYKHYNEDNYFLSPVMNVFINDTHVIALFLKQKKYTIIPLNKIGGKQLITEKNLFNVLNRFSGKNRFSRKKEISDMLATHGFKETPIKDLIMHLFILQN